MEKGSEPWEVRREDTFTIAIETDGEVRMWLEEKLVMNKTRGYQAFVRIVERLPAGFSFIRIEYDP